jgi:hypothetical protein
MADSVTSTVLADTPTLYGVHLTCVSDSTGESAVIKVDKSTLVGPTSAEPSALDFIQARWNIQGFSSVRLFWDHTTDDRAMVLSGNGEESFTPRRDLDFPAPGKVKLNDPVSAGGTGDILLTSVGASGTATYGITLWFAKRA